MADMVTPGALKEKLKKLPPVPVITYVNSPASVKALTTVCCTSANVTQITNSLDNDEILMVPDRNLARYAMTGTDKKIHLWDGFCPIHDRLLPEDVKKVRKDHPQAVFIAHPECRPEVLSLADKIASTSGMLKFVNESKEKEFIIGTEIGLIYPLKKANPDKIFYPASAEMECPDMKKISLNDIAKSLKFMDGEVKVPEEIRKPALKAVQRMIGIKK
jgi:quinolinate synthase